MGSSQTGFDSQHQCRVIIIELIELSSVQFDLPLVSIRKWKAFICNQDISTPSCAQTEAAALTINKWSLWAKLPELTTLHIQLALQVIFFCHKLLYVLYSLSTFC